MSLKETVRDWMRQSFAWDFAEKQRIARAAMAQGMGFNPEQYARPFPGTPVIIMSNEEKTAPPVASPAPGFLKSPAGKFIINALGTALLGGAAGAGAVYLSGGGYSVPKPQEFEIQWKVVDSKMEQKVVPIEPGK